MGLEGKVQQVTVSVLNDKCETFETRPVKCTIENMENTFKCEISAFTAERVTGNLQVTDWSKHAHAWKHLQSIPFQKIGAHTTVDILIGADYPELHYSIRDVCGNHGEPIARKTQLGWTCIGKKNASYADQFQSNFIRTHFTHEKEPNETTNTLLRQFWKIENLGSSGEDTDDKKQNEIRDKMKKSIKYVDDRYQIACPWKNETDDLPDNRVMASQRLENTEKRIKKSPELSEMYSNTINQYVEKGYIQKVNLDDDKAKKKWFLPHFPVIRMDKETTKLRVVFDASAKHKDVCLNDFIDKGPKLQRELFDVLLRFRKERIALVCDISEMYLQIRIEPKDRPFFRFLWRNLEEKEPDEYEFNRIVFGINSSPFQAMLVTQSHAINHAEEFPRAAETVLKSTYMDDSLDSVEDVSKAILLQKDLSQLWKKAGMHARKWTSNSREVMEQIPIEDRALQVDLQKDDLPTTKALGLIWSAESDNFSFKVEPLTKNFKFTKRSIMQKIATIFDPLGMLSPFTIRAKQILQEIWASASEWDSEINEELSEKARTWFTELQKITEIKIPRCLKRENGNVKSFTLHAFADASKSGYGSALYAITEYEDETKSCRIIASKNKVTPPESISIPRLELLAAVLACKLATSITLTMNMDVKNVIFWSDSTTVLWWIRNTSQKYKQFVANRVKEIQNTTDPSQWRYIPTKENPADLLTRGIDSANLKDNTLWWHGPKYLEEPESNWPNNPINVKEINAKDELKTQEITHFTAETGATWRLNPDRFSDWKRLTRIQSWVTRFIINCRKQPNERRNGELSPEELMSTEKQLIRKSQNENFGNEIAMLKKGQQVQVSSKIRELNPKLDEDEILRCDGRLQYAEYLPYETRYPTILPRRSKITALIVKKYHEDANHSAGTNQTLASLSTRFWIVSAREEIKEWEKECSKCRRWKAKPTLQIMAPLPKIRTEQSLQAFTNASVDFAGPFITKQGRGKSRQKRYLCVFTCLATRAVHLEIAMGLDTDSFLNAFYRMVNRRGLPKSITSDNGTNFIGSEKELRKLAECLDKNKIQKKTADRGVEWHFNPPLGPHFGGAHEIMVKAAKRAIYATLENSDISDEELMTAFTGAEALINSKPLTYQSANPKDPSPITPNHFLHGKVGGNFAPEAIDNTNYNIKKRWRRIQELVRHFWHRWLREWLPGLNRRKKWTKLQRDIHIGDIVVIIDTETPRGQWPLGRVINTYPGPDGHVRVVKLKTGQKEIKRPITRISLLCD